MEKKVFIAIGRTGPIGKYTMAFPALAIGSVDLLRPRC